MMRCCNSGLGLQEVSLVNLLAQRQHIKTSVLLMLVILISTVRVGTLHQQMLNCAEGDRMKLGKSVQEEKRGIMSSSNDSWICMILISLKLPLSLMRNRGNATIYFGWQSTDPLQATWPIDNLG
jgi:hypothetical protein